MPGKHPLFLLQALSSGWAALAFELLRIVFKLKQKALNNQISHFKMTLTDAWTAACEEPAPLNQLLKYHFILRYTRTALNYYRQWGFRLTCDKEDFIMRGFWQIRPVPNVISSFKIVHWLFFLIFSQQRWSKWAYRKQYYLIDAVSL